MLYQNAQHSIGKYSRSRSCVSILAQIREIGLQEKKSEDISTLEKLSGSLVDII